MDKILTYTEVLGRSLEKRVLLRFGRLASKGSSGGLLSGLGFGRLVIETRSASL